MTDEVPQTEGAPSDAERLEAGSAVREPTVRDRLAAAGLCAERIAGSTTYYFSSRENLLAQAFERLAQRWLDRATAYLQAQPLDLDLDRAAEVVVGVVTATAVDQDGGIGGEVGDLLVMYERYLEAGRYPTLRPAVGAYDDRLVSLVHHVVQRAELTPSPATIRLLLAVVDGTILNALAHGAPAARVAQQAGQAVRLLLSGPSPLWSSPI